MEKISRMAGFVDVYDLHLMTQLGVMTEKYCYTLSVECKF